MPINLQLNKLIVRFWRIYIVTSLLMVEKQQTSRPQINQCSNKKKMCRAHVNHFQVQRHFNYACQGCLMPKWDAI